MAAAKRKPRPANEEITLRHVWLAGLGLVVIARRETLAAAGRVVERADALQRRVQNLADDAKSNVRESIENVRGQVEPKVLKFSAEVESRLAPVLDKLGIKPQGKRPARKTRKTAAKKKPQARRAAAPRKGARRTSRRA